MSTKLRFTKPSPASSTFNGFINDLHVCTIVRSWRYGKNAGYVYSLYKTNSDVVIDSSCFYVDVTKSARTIAASFLSN